jgi:hypothetical protein
MLTPALAQDFNEGRRKTQTIESPSRFPEQVFSFSVQCISVQCEPNNIQHLRAAIQASGKSSGRFAFGPRNQHRVSINC